MPGDLKVGRGREQLRMVPTRSASATRRPATRRPDIADGGPHRTTIDGEHRPHRV